MVDIDTSKRCERCGAQAFVMTEVNGTELEWCMHHYRAYQVKLEQTSTRVSIREEQYLAWSGARV